MLEPLRGVPFGFFSFGGFGTFGFFGSLAPKTGGYSKRLFTVAIEENLAAWSWIVAGIFYAVLWFQARGKPVREAVEMTSSVA